MQYVLTGATGFIGRALRRRLTAEGDQWRLLTRRPSVGPGEIAWNPLSEAAPREALEGADVVVHLAGESVAQRWSGEVKRRIRDSRVLGTRNLVAGLAELERRPKVLVCASATGYYGDRGDEELVETSGPGTGFLAEACVEWEREAHAAEWLGMRVVRVRTGVALGQGGGALAKMLPPFKMGAGGRLGDGRQWMSWIHLDDLASLFLWASRTDAVSGAVNGTAPNPVRNDEFTRVLAATLHRPALFPVPGLALRALYGEMAEILLDSQRVLPDVALDGGFEFRYPSLGGALAQLLD